MRSWSQGYLGDIWGICQPKPTLDQLVMINDCMTEKNTNAKQTDIGIQGTRLGILCSQFRNENYASTRKPQFSSKVFPATATQPISSLLRN